MEKIDFGIGRVMRGIRYIAYLLGKILALAFIFVGGCILAAIILPLLSFFPDQNHEQAQRIIHRLFRMYLRVLCFVHLIRLDVEGKEQFATFGGRLVIANHPSLLDVVILMALIPRVQCIVKHQLWDRGWLKGLMQRVGYIRNDLEPEDMVKACKASLRDGRCLIIFPEGTRTPPGKKPVFQRGFANIATLTETPIQPVYIECNPPFLYKGEPWWHVPDELPYFRITVGDCLDAKCYSLYGLRSIATRKLVESLELQYAERIHARQPRVGAQEAHY